MQLNIDTDGLHQDPDPTGELTTATPIVDTNASFTISVWVKPINEAGVILSEDGAHASRFILWGDAPSKSWRFALATADTDSWLYNQIVAPAGSIQLGVWTHLQASYNATTTTMSLYVNDTLAVTGQHSVTTTWPTDGGLVVGRYRYQSQPQQYYSGQISNLQIWNRPLAPGQISLRAHANGRYVSADNDGTSPLIANRDTIGDWEKFLLVHNADGSSSLKALANGKYVSADTAGTSPLIANRDAIGEWESFDIIEG